MQNESDIKSWHKTQIRRDSNGIDRDDTASTQSKRQHLHNACMLRLEFHQRPLLRSEQLHRSIPGNQSRISCAAQRYNGTPSPFSFCPSPAFTVRVAVFRRVWRGWAASTNHHARTRDCVRDASLHLHLLLTFYTHCAHLYTFISLQKFFKRKQN